MKSLTKLALTAGLCLAALSSAWAETHEVMMYTKNPDNKKERNVFIPAFLVAKPGDTVKFMVAEKGHNSASKDGMLPEGAAEWKGKISKEIEVTLEKPGIYGYVCSPHEALGMVGMIVVEGEGMLANLDAVKGTKMKGKSKKIFADLIAQAEALKN